MNRVKQIICKLLGHKWGYKTYLEYNNRKDSYIKKRRCKRCDYREVFTKNEEWKTK